MAQLNQLDVAPRTQSQRIAVPPWLAAAAILIITCIVYIPAMRGGFIWDDDTHLINNIVLQEDGLYRAWFTRDAFVYYPVTWTSYWIEYQLWGLEKSASDFWWEWDATGYHSTNVLLHVLCAILIWRVLLRLKIPGALVIAIIFAVHPVNVESVAWVTQRKNLLALLFFASAILFYLRFESRGRRMEYWLAAACFLLGMLSKGAIVALPAVLLLLAWWQRGRITRTDILRSLPFFAIGLGMSVVELYFQYSGENVGAADVRTDSLLARIAGVGWVVWFYIYKALIPINLAFVYPRWEIDHTTVMAWLPNLALFAALAIFFIYRKSWGRPFLIAVLYFCFTIFPAAGLFHFYYLKYSFVADHYQYISIIGVIALVISLALTRLGRLRLHPRWALLPMLAPSLLIIFLGALTWRQASLYENYERVFRDSIAKYPTGWMAHHNLANYLQATGHVRESIHHYRETLELNPQHDSAAANLAQAHLALDELEEAERILREAAAAQPENELYRYEYGTLLSRLGRTDEAMRQWREAIRIDPNHAFAHISLGYALFERGEYAEAAAHLDRAIELAPEFAAQTNLAAVRDEALRRAR